jgi:hypothetical protein
MEPLKPRKVKPAAPKVKERLLDSDEVDIPKSKKNAVKKAPSSSTLMQDFQANILQLLSKTGGGLLLGGFLLFAFQAKAKRRGQQTIPEEMLMPAIIGVAMIGAAGGFMLGMRDIIMTRLENQQPVPLFWKILFGYGIWSALFVWIPLIIAITLAITLMTIGIG